jgi:hypothetical protein
MSICFLCKNHEPIEDDIAKSTPLNACHAKVGRRHWWLRKIFGTGYIDIFSKDWLYPNDSLGNCSYYKRKLSATLKLICSI